MPAPRGALAIALAALAAGCALGGTVAAVVIPPPLPTSVAPESAAATVRASTAQFDDSRQARVVLAVDTTSGLRSAAAGVLTALACTPGTAVVSGSSPFSLDGRPVIALATAVPPWRDLAVGDEGADVAGVEAELARLGGGLAPDAYWSWADALAADALLGVITTDDGTLQRASLAWLPATSVPVGECPVALGDTVGAGAGILGYAPRITLATVVPAPGAVEGERALAIEGGTLPVAADGTITDPAALAALAATPEFLALDPARVPPTLTLPWVLVAPVDVTVVPPGAVFGLRGEEGCVESDGAVVRVVVVASQLGRTLVTAERRLGELAVRPDPGRPCG